MVPGERVGKERKAKGKESKIKERKGKERKTVKSRSKVWTDDSVFPSWWLLAVCALQLLEDLAQTTERRQIRVNVLRFIIICSTIETHKGGGQILHGKAIPSMWRRLAATDDAPTFILFPLSRFFLFSPSFRSCIQLIKLERCQNWGNEWLGEAGVRPQWFPTERSSG